MGYKASRLSVLEARHRDLDPTPLKALLLKTDLGPELLAPIRQTVQGCKSPQRVG